MVTQGILRFNTSSDHQISSGDQQSWSSTKLVHALIMTKKHHQATVFSLKYGVHLWNEKGCMTNNKFKGNQCH